MPGETWEQEAAELRATITGLTAELGKRPTPEQLAELREALNLQTAELKALKEKAPDNSRAEALAANLETKLSELTAKLATLTPPPPPPSPEGAPPVPPTSRKKAFI